MLSKDKEKKKNNNSEKHNILQVIYSLEYGGSELLAYELASKINKKRFKISVCAVDIGGKLTPLLDNNKIPWFVLNRQKVFDFKVWTSLYKLFKSENIKVVQTHHFPQLFNAFIPAILCRVKIVHTEHEIYSYLKNKRNLFILKILSRFCHGFTTVGESITRFFLENNISSRSGIVTIANGINIKRFSPEVKVDKTDFGFNIKNIIIGAVARLAPEKDHETLIRAFHKLYRQISITRLLIIGDGSLRGHLEKLCSSLGIKDVVYFFGSRDDVNKLLSIIDIFVLSSIEEGLPVSILEAMSSGKAIISTSVGEIPKVIIDEKTGLLFNARDYNSLYNLISLLINNKQLAYEIGKNARIEIEKKYSQQKMLKDYESLYERVIKS